MWRVVLGRDTDLSLGCASMTQTGIGMTQTGRPASWFTWRATARSDANWRELMRPVPRVTQMTQMTQMPDGVSRIGHLARNDPLLSFLSSGNFVPIRRKPAHT